MEFDVSSVARAVRDRFEHAIEIRALHLVGVHFCAERNAQDALNLMVSLNLPDDDENVIAQRFVEGRRQALSVRGALGGAGAGAAPSVVDGGGGPKKTRGYRIRSHGAQRPPAPARAGTGAGPRGKRLWSLGSGDDESWRSWRPGAALRGLASRVRAACRFCRVVVHSVRRREDDVAYAEADAAYEDFGAETTRPDPRRPRLERSDTVEWSPKRRPRWGVRWRLDVKHLFATDARPARVPRRSWTLTQGSRPRSLAGRRRPSLS